MIPDFKLKFSDGVYDVLGYVDTGSGYEWSVTALIQRQSDEALFLARDSGCSCNYFGDYDGAIDKQVFSIEEAIREVGGSIGQELKKSIETMERVYE